MKNLVFVLFLFVSCTQQIVQQKTVIQKEPDPLALEYVNKGIDQIDNQKDYGGAMLSFTRAIEIDNTYAKAYYGRGIVKVILNQTAAALIDLDRAGELGEIEAYNIANKIRKRQFWQKVIINL